MNSVLRIGIPHCSIQSIECLGDLGIAMRGRHEPGLECGRSQIHAAIERGVKESLEHLDVALLRSSEIAHRTRVKKESPHRSCTAGGERNAYPRCDLGEAIHQGRCSPR